MKDLLIYLYPITQFIIFFFYIPYIRSVVESETADAINVPAQLSFFVTGGIAALYMFIVNQDILAGGIIVVHILIGIVWSLLDGEILNSLIVFRLLGIRSFHGCCKVTQIHKGFRLGHNKMGHLKR